MCVKSDTENNVLLVAAALVSQFTRAHVKALLDHAATVISCLIHSCNKILHTEITFRYAKINLKRKLLAHAGLLDSPQSSWIRETHSIWNKIVVVTTIPAIPLHHWHMWTGWPMARYIFCYATDGCAQFMLHFMCGMSVPVARSNCEQAGLPCVGGWVTASWLVFLASADGAAAKRLAVAVCAPHKPCRCKGTCDWLACQRSASLYAVASTAWPNGHWNCRGHCWFTNACYNVEGSHKFKKLKYLS
jgi:hypothetical protein